MNKNLITDLQSITQIKKYVFDKCSDIGNALIGDYINELDLNNEQVLDIDIGIGTISMLVLEDSIKYIFTPTQELESIIINTLENKESPVVEQLEAKLNHKVMSTYKDLM